MNDERELVVVEDLDQVCSNFRIPCFFPGKTSSQRVRELKRDENNERIGTVAFSVVIWRALCLFCIETGKGSHVPITIFEVDETITEMRARLKLGETLVNIRESIPLFGTI